MSDDLGIRPHREPPHDAARPTRIWPSLVIGLTAPCLAVLPIIILFWEPITSSQVSMETLSKDPAFNVAAIVASQLGFLLISVVAARLSQVPADERVGLLPYRGPWWAIPVLALACYGASSLGSFAFGFLKLESPEEMANLRTALMGSTGPLQVLLVLGIVIGAPVAEELLYRGYVLRGLLRGLHPLNAIFMSAWFFSVAHGSVEYQLLILPMGMFLAWIAYRTKSIWPGVWAHGYNNLLSVLQGLLPADLSLRIFREIGVPSAFEYAGWAALPFAIWILCRPGMFEQHLESDPPAFIEPEPMS